MPRRLEPMLAKPGAVPESDSDDWAYEIKWDGVRVLGYAEDGEWCMLSRRLEDVSAPEGVTLLDDLHDTVIATVTAPTREVEPEETAEEAAEGEEGELEAEAPEGAADEAAGGDAAGEPGTTRD